MPLIENGFVYRDCRGDYIKIVTYDSHGGPRREYDRVGSLDHATMLFTYPSRELYNESLRQGWERVKVKRITAINKLQDDEE